MRRLVLALLVSLGVVLGATSCGSEGTAGGRDAGKSAETEAAGAEDSGEKKAEAESGEQEEGKNRETEKAEVSEGMTGYDNGCVRFEYDGEKLDIYEFTDFAGMGYALYMGTPESYSAELMEQNFVAILLLPPGAISAENALAWRLDVDEENGLSVSETEEAAGESGRRVYSFTVSDGEKELARRVAFGENDEGIVIADVWMADASLEKTLFTVWDSLTMYAPVENVDENMLTDGAEEASGEEDLEGMFSEEPPELNGEQEAELSRLRAECAYEYLEPVPVQDGEEIRFAYVPAGAANTYIDTGVIGGGCGHTVNVMFREGSGKDGLDLAVQEQEAMFMAMKQFKGMTTNNTEAYGDDEEMEVLASTEEIKEEIITYTHMVNGTEYPAYEFIRAEDLGDGLIRVVTVKKMPAWDQTGAEGMLRELSDAYGFDPGVLPEE